MSRHPRRHGALLGATALVACNLLFGTARAQTADSRIGAIEAQLHALQAELAQIKRESAQKEAAARREGAQKDAAVRSAQADAARARLTAEQTQARVASLPPAGSQGNVPSASQPPASPARAGVERVAGTGLGLGIGPAHPDISSPKTDWTSLNINGLSAGSQNAGVTGPLGTFHIGGITLQLGGFFAAEAAFRSRNESTSIGTNFNAIPFSQAQAAHETELRLTAQQSRFALLAHGDIDKDHKLEGYAELDALGAAPTANSNESNSYTPRLRLVYASYDDDMSDFHALVGQNWSLATLYKQGVTPHQENVPLTIDSQYVPGFTWARQPQLRVAKGFGDGKYYLAASLESPQAVFTTGPNGTGVDLGTVNSSNPGIAQLTPGQAYSSDVAPDVIVKATADPGYGHYEVYGLARFLGDRVSVVGNGHGNTRLAGGVGAGTILPILGDKLSFQASGIAGYGLGRYGTSQLPDATISRSGAPAPLPEVQALVGLVGHPVPEVDLYSYVGTEQIGKKTFDVGGRPFGYGNPLYVNAGCDIELSPLVCTGNTSGIVQGTIGGWWRFLQGDYGTVQSGIQYAYTRRSIFKGVTAPGGSGNKGTDENGVLFSLRYLPFQ